ncbi:MAG: glutamine-hydrolyzing GMP synthase [Bdellovibrionaceae bacterium]|jgi:GMP synthase (glutamine-hydrolysing)|nr:glutamine-hydrolyzing GMP synthase [Pseudobdellovibrionaceae bacterium]
MKNSVVILDFGSQFTQLIARRIRESGVYAEIFPFNYDIEKIKALEPKAIILSGGPFSVYDKEAPQRDLKPLDALAPLLGVCYGMQLMMHTFGGKVHSSEQREYGLTAMQWQVPHAGFPDSQKVWMSHGDVVDRLAPGYELHAKSNSGHPAVVKSEKNWCFQFHPEVSHTQLGAELIEDFIFNHCAIEKNWDPQSTIQRLKKYIQDLVPEGDHVLCALSGGVDSTVMGTLLTQAIGADRVNCVFVDNGLLRKNEFTEVLEIYKKLGLNVQGVDASEDFLQALAGQADPETKRKIIGSKFIDVFKKSIDGLVPMQWLAQGTLYPDVIESVSLYGKSVTIKSHHNVGGLPEDLNLKLVEPLRELFKDEVRAIGKELGIPRENLWRHPFPGPGLGIRIMGAITKEDLQILQNADDVYIKALKEYDLYDKIWQAFCVLLPVHTVGVQGDSRTYDKVLAIRAVTSKDGMTADWFDFPPAFLREVSNRITNEVRGVNRVVYDVTSKPPGTIEWE